jgi:hypothetical protein
MNDRELDEILAAWTAPAPPSSLRERVRAGFAVRATEIEMPSARGWARVFLPGWRRSLLVGLTLALVALLLVVTEALPKTLELFSSGLQSPYRVDSELVRYAKDGTATVEMYLTSFNDQGGREIILSRSLPGNPLGTAASRTLDAIPNVFGPLLLRLARITNPGIANVASTPKVVYECGEDCLMVKSWSLPSYTANAASGCVDANVVDRQTTILGYSTAAIQMEQSARRRMKIWLAPALGCFALQIETQEQQADGTFHLLSRKSALKVSWNQ